MEPRLNVSSSRSRLGLNNPISDTSYEVAGNLTHESGLFNPTVEVLSHGDLMKSLAQTLNVPFKEVYTGSTVEQRLVGLAGITTSQQNSCYRRESGTINTYFKLSFSSEAEQQGFVLAYNQRFPGFIKSVGSYDSRQQTKIIVDTRILYKRVAVSMVNGHINNHAATNISMPETTNLSQVRSNIVDSQVPSQRHNVVADHNVVTTSITSVSHPIKVPSHQELMNHLAKTLAVDYSEVCTGSTVEQRLVGLAGISTSQQNSCYRRESGTTDTYFKLSFGSEAEQHQFVSIYNQKFPGLIKSVDNYQINQLTKLVVDTRKLYEEVAIDLKVFHSGVKVSIGRILERYQMVIPPVDFKELLINLIRNCSVVYTKLGEPNVEIIRSYDINNLKNLIIEGSVLEEKLVKDLAQALIQKRGLNVCFGDNTTSLLSIINLIDDSYVKARLIFSMIQDLNIDDISNIADALRNILYLNDIYLKDSRLCKFIIDKLMVKKITDSATKLVDFEAKEIIILQNYIESQGKEEFMLNNSSLMVQIIYYGRKLSPDHSSLKELIESLEMSYLRSNCIDSVLNKVRDIDMDVYNLIFISRDKTVKLAVSEEYYQKWALGENISNPLAITEALMFDRENEIIAINNPDETVNMFKLFQHQYSLCQNEVKFNLLLNLLNLGNYRDDFVAALNNRRYNRDYTSIMHKNAFADIFKEFVIGGENIISLTGASALEIIITPEHFREIMITYNEMDSTPKKQAQLLVCLSAVFAKYSSEYFFGTSFDSNTSLRNYALALLNKALSLDSTVINTATYLQDNDNNWKDKFTGNKGRFSCTALLSSSIIAEINTKFPEVLRTILPPAWG